MADFPRKVALLLSMGAILLLCACARTEICGEGTDEAVGEIPIVSFAVQTQEIEHEGRVLYRGTVNMPSLSLPNGEKGAQDRANATLQAAGEAMISFPYDLDLLIGQSEANSDFQPYVTQVVASVPLLGKAYCSVLFAAEIRGGGLGSDYAYRGVTLNAVTGESVMLGEAFGMSEETVRLLFSAAFSADMEKSPQYYDDPHGGVREEWIKADCFCLTENGVMLWMPSDTVSLGASPLLTLDFDAIYMLTGFRVKMQTE